ncbi:caspase-1-like [Ostrinia nubilalis]|uniref:caspase-1-like n=1 Tax=Ostrinia nubilalis TaxID=29057 RepID=UPI00308252D4
MDASEPDIKFFNSKPGNSSQNVEPTVEEPSPHRRMPQYSPESLYYDMSGEKYLLIFNHFKYQCTRYFRFKTPKPRNGTDQDVKVLKGLFSSLGFKVLTYNDYTHDQIIRTIGTISKQDHSLTSCLAVAIMTHGDKNGELFAADRPYQLKDITNMFEGGDASLVNKPKIFFIQACRGELADPGRTIQFDGDEDNTLHVPTHIDFLVACSTVEDHISWRDIGGSWFFQELCEVIRTHHEQMDLLHMLTLVTRNVALGHSSNVPKDAKFDKKKQTPETRFTLTKLLRFSTY